MTTFCCVLSQTSAVEMFGGWGYVILGWWLKISVHCLYFFDVVPEDVYLQHANVLKLTFSHQDGRVYELECVRSVLRMKQVIPTAPLFVSQFLPLQKNDAHSKTFIEMDKKTTFRY